MRNPWIALPTSAPFVLDKDRPTVEAFNRVVKPRHKLQTHVLPEPFSGRVRTATVLVLQLNPGFAGSEARWHRNPAFARALRANNAHQPLDYPQLGLDPAWERTPGGRWAVPRLRRVVEALGDIRRVARKLGSVEFHGYHSRQFRPIPVTLPSQHYGFELVRRAVRRNAVIVVVRGYDLWRVAVPELNDHSLVFRPHNAQSAYITEASLGRRGFRAVVAALS